MDVLAEKTMLMSPFGSNWADESFGNLDDTTQAALKHFTFIFCFFSSKWLLWVSGILALGYVEQTRYMLKKKKK